MSIQIENLVHAATSILTKNWERCDRETGEECRGMKCDFPEHRVLAILDQIAAENKK